MTKEISSTALDFLDHLAGRSVTWSELPSPIKLILCSNVIEVRSRRLWRLSIKLREVPIGDAGHEGVNASEYVLSALKEIFGEDHLFVGALRSQPSPHDEGLFVELIVSYDFGWSSSGLLVKELVEKHWLVIKCKFEMIIDEQLCEDHLIGGNCGSAASHLFNALSTPNQTRRRLQQRSGGPIKRKPKKSVVSSTKTIVQRSIRAVGSRRHVDTYEFDDLLILPEKVVSLGAEWWDEFQPEIASLICDEQSMA